MVMANTSNKNISLKVLLYGLISLIAMVIFADSAKAASTSGFDQYGYNYKARVFVGTCKSWAIAGGQDASNFCGSYLNDKLVMKWNEAWDDCNANGNDDPKYCAGAWDTNHWNGKVPGGSGEIYQFKSIWVGSAGEDSLYWREGGQLLWDNYETIFEQTSGSGPAVKLVHATPGGLGFMPKF